MSKIFLTSDSHFDHANIIKFCKRPFKNVGHMEKELVDNWNSVVGPDDTIFHIGDFMMSKNSDKLESLLKRLNGNKHLILGNHDNMKPFAYVDAGFQSVHTSLKLHRDTYLNGDIYLVHDPAVRCALPEEAILLHGHVHNFYKFFPERNCINFSVEMWNYTPVELDIALGQLYVAKENEEKEEDNSDEYGV